MRFYLSLLFFLTHYQSLCVGVLNSTTDSNSLNPIDSSVSIDLHQCGSGSKIYNSTTMAMGTTLYNLINSCDIICCPSNRTNETSTYVYSINHYNFTELFFFRFY